MTRAKTYTTSCSPSAQSICGPPSKGATRCAAPMSALGKQTFAVHQPMLPSKCGAKGNVR